MELNQLTILFVVALPALVLWTANRRSQQGREEEHSLSQSELTDLKAACQTLVRDLQRAADEATRQVDAAVARAEIITSKLDDALPALNIIVEDDEDEGERADQVILAGDCEPESRDRLIEAADAFRRVYDLADQGLSAHDIALRENRSPGEVKLLLDIRDVHLGRKAV